MDKRESLQRYFGALASGERQLAPRQRGERLEALMSVELADDDVDDDSRIVPLGTVRNQATTTAAASPSSHNDSRIAAPPTPKRPKRSCVYLFFTPVEGKSGEYRCKFSQCRGHTYSAGTSTTNLLKHLKNAHKQAYQSTLACQEKGLQPDESFAAELISSERRGNVSVDTLLSGALEKRTALTIKLLAWIIIDAKPFSIVRSPRFREFLATFCYTPPSTRQLLRYLRALQDTVHCIIQQKLARLEFVSVSADEWSAANMLSFLSLAYQGFDDNMKLIQCEDLIQFPPPHTAERYKQYIQGRIDFRTSNKVMLVSLTADGAAAIQNACNAIVGCPDTVWCLAHQLQLAINDIIHVPDHPYQGAIQKVRLWVLAIRTHMLPRDVLQKEEELANVKQQQLVLDVATRWDSVLDMINVFLKLWPIVSRIADQGVLDELVAGDQNITAEDIAQLTAAATVLESFAKVTKASGAQKFSPIVYVPQMIQRLFHDLDVDRAKDTTLTIRFKGLLRDRLAARMQNIMQNPSPQLLAAMLDPLQHNLPCIGNNDVLKNAVNEEMIKQIIPLNTERTLATGEVVVAATEEQARAELRDYHTLCERNAAVFETMLHTEVAWSAEAHDKLCKWWADHRDYKLLFRTARALLAIRATSTPNERAFSAAGEQHAIKRRSISPDTLAAVCMIAGNIDESMMLDQLVARARQVARERSGQDPFAAIEGDDAEEMAEEGI